MDYITAPPNIQRYSNGTPILGTTQIGGEAPGGLKARLRDHAVCEALENGGKRGV